ncbi:hypothetical protein [Frankia sp. Cr2]|uniref:hypothetical protein n=1 Tax=Frankia sp. Cr2 TaxID=3073932 RepID=UPI002AD3D92A|nr:hypothetical protein [Frankia sp. Cr2]
MPSDLERSRLLLVWLQARRAVDHCLSDLLAAGPAGERRVREQLELVHDLENRAQEAFVRYRRAAATSLRSDLPTEATTSDAADLVDVADVDVADIADMADVIDIADVTELMDRTGPTNRPRLGVVRTDEHWHEPGLLSESKRPVSGPIAAPAATPTQTTTQTTMPAPSGCGLGSQGAATEPGVFPTLPGSTAAPAPHTGRDGETGVTRGLRGPRGDQRRHR